jgi:hypothetical protein
MKKVSFKIRTSVKAGGFFHKPPTSKPFPRMLYGIVALYGVIQPMYAVEVAAPVDSTGG